MLTKIKELKTKIPATKLSSKPVKTNEQYLVGLDIGTEFIKALIGRVVGDKVEIIGVGKTHQEQSDMQAGAIADIAGVVQNCDRALSAAEQQAGVSAKMAVIGIAGELVKGTVNTVRFARKDPTKEITDSEIKKIIDIVQQKSEAKARTQLAWELGGKDVDVKLVNSALVRMDIDGYKVTNPVGFQGRDVVVELYTAFAPLIHIGALERTANELDLDLLAVAAEPFAVARSVIGDDPNNSTSAILMDVGGGTTDIAIVNEGGVEGTKMFGIGGRAFTKSIERDMGVDYLKAEALKLNLNEPKTSKEKAQMAEVSLRKTLNIWTSGVELALEEFEKLDHLPNKILLCGGGSSLEMLVEQLSAEDWHRGMAFTRKPIVQHIKPEEVSGIIDTTGDVVDHTFVTAMGLLRVGVDTLFQTNNTSAEGSVRDKLNKLLKT